LRVCGATRTAVFSLVLAEAVVVGAFAAVTGVALARALGAMWNRWLGAKLPAFPFKPDDWFVWSPRDVALAAGFGVLACALSAVWPARRAASTDPASVLSRGVF
jgi:putative ABC transport system permease protein